ncbi:DUF6266 family protein [Plebeiibacterium sediminum]|uniref:DUF6266 family protein n=1 Tax=Plebeiibacterium sediminum TaxID=2992112 RepID=A0AAE3M3H0_9BACT|nr:DUF6266 family protein [Plebeiobacterium sediminum]MCW3786434.1 DUF6266 family protein [Plebeiobacterium sediminum]
MGKFVKGLNGGFSGRVGSTVGSKWKGINYMKSLPDIRDKKSSEKQVMQRARFAFAARFLQPLYPVFKQGLKAQGVNQSPQNAAFSEFLNYALIGEYPDFGIDYPNLVFAKGSIQVADKPAVTIEDEQIVFTWSDNPNALKYVGTMQALLVGIAEGGYPSYSVDEYTRADGKGSLYMPNAPSGTPIHCYLAFASSGKMGTASNSIYLGTVTAP